MHGGITMPAKRKVPKPRKKERPTLPPQARAERQGLNLQEAKARYEQIRLQFIQTELELAATLVDLAKSSRDPQAAERRTARAEEAYDSAIHFLGQRGVSPEVRREMQTRVKEVRAAIDSLFQEPPAGERRPDGVMPASSPR